MLSKKFLAQDQIPAMKEIVCASDCVYATRDLLHSGDFTSARIAAENAVRSLKELERLEERKNRNDKLVSAALEIIKAGEDIATAIHRIRGKCLSSNVN